jgi:hypothetical protein
MRTLCGILCIFLCLYMLSFARVVRVQDGTVNAYLNGVKSTQPRMLRQSL